jgi:hypothetical protein
VCQFAIEAVPFDGDGRDDIEHPLRKWPSLSDGKRAVHRIHGENAVYRTEQPQDQSYCARNALAGQAAQQT